MKKVLSLVIISLLILAGCGSSTTELDPNEQVTLKVMHWGWGTEGDAASAEQAIVAAYEAKNPNVKIEMISQEGDYEDDLSQLIAAGDAPDVFVFAGTDPIVNGWAKDVTDFTKSDESYANMSSVIKDSLEVDGKSYAVPISINFMGITQSGAVLEQLNMEPLEWGFTTDQFKQAVLDATTDKTLGLSNHDGFSWIAPTLENSTRYWQSYGKDDVYDYDSAEMNEAVEIMTDFCTKNAVEVCNDTVIPEGTWAFDSGKLAYNYEGTWQTEELLEKYDWQFIGLPGGNFTIIPDYMYVSETSQNAEWAFDFITFFGDEGYQIRHDIADANNGVVPIPLINNDENYELLKEAYSDSNPGIVKAYDEMVAGTNGIVEGFKVIPGYPQSAKLAETGIARPDGDGVYTVEQVLEAVMKGELAYDDVKNELTKIANDAHEQALAAIGS